MVSFSTFASSLHSNKILRATTERKEKIIEEIENLEIQNKGTSYEDAFEKSLEMLRAGEKDEFGKPCENGENILLFLTDGTPTKGKRTLGELKQVIDSKNVPITLFSYGINL